MHALALFGHGGPEQLRYVNDLATPEPGPGEVRVRVVATGVNHVDLVVRRGYPGVTMPFPHVPGGDVAGFVDAVGSGVSGWRVGDRVVSHPMVSCGTCGLCLRGDALLCVRWQYLGLHRWGGYAEYVVVPSANLVALPATVGFEQAAALPVAGLTAYHALHTVGELQEGETFFLWGGAGALGTFAVQLARRRGARVIATASSEARMADLARLGCDLVLDRRHDDVAARVAAFAPEGVDVALDFVGPATFATSHAMLRKGGRLLLCGMITGRETTFSIHMTYLKHASIRGLYLGTHAELEALVGLVASGDIVPEIGAALPLAEAVEAHEMLERSAVAGKIVLAV
jgi:NADPH:quinone reductase-like Zn-dependent oxidoreductase